LIQLLESVRCWHAYPPPGSLAAAKQANWQGPLHCAVLPRMQVGMLDASFVEGGLSWQQSH
jgi:hypothetical protein